MSKFDYTIRVSQRARRVSLRVTAAEGLSVVVPRRFDQSTVAGLLIQKQAWIEKALLRVADAPAPLAADFRPPHLHLTALGERWQIEYREGQVAQSAQAQRQASEPLLKLDPSNIHSPQCQPSKTSVAEKSQLMEQRHQRKLRLMAAGEQVVTFALLRGWLRQRARDELVPRTHALADALGFKINKVTIRNQRSRWGSCSSKSNISLNLKLLFVTPQQLRYVLVHELCHTRQMNHSPAFWRLVERFEPEYRAIKPTLRHAWQNIPVWI